MTPEEKVRITILAPLLFLLLATHVSLRSSYSAYSSQSNLELWLG